MSGDTEETVMRVEICVRPDGMTHTFHERGDAFMSDLKELCRRHDLYYSGTSSFVPYERYLELMRYGMSGGRLQAVIDLLDEGDLRAAARAIDSLGLDLYRARRLDRVADALHTLEHTDDN